MWGIKRTLETGVGIRQGFQWIRPIKLSGISKKGRNWELQQDQFRISV